MEDRIIALREKHEKEVNYQNIAVLGGNAMKFLPNFFSMRTIKDVFLLQIPILSKESIKPESPPPRCCRSIYVLRRGGCTPLMMELLMVKHLDDHPLFERLDKEWEKKMTNVSIMYGSTEEGQKVAKKQR